jgi:hypothetical protein
MTGAYDLQPGKRWRLVASQPERNPRRIAFAAKTAGAVALLHARSGPKWRKVAPAITGVEGALERLQSALGTKKSICERPPTAPRIFIDDFNAGSRPGSRAGRQSVLVGVADGWGQAAGFQDDEIVRTGRQEGERLPVAGRRWVSMRVSRLSCFTVATGR